MIKGWGLWWRARSSEKRYTRAATDIYTDPTVTAKPRIEMKVRLASVVLATCDKTMNAPTTVVAKVE